MKREQKVRIVSVDRRYRLEPYPAMPIFNHKLGTYITGQHVNPSDTSTKNNLTVKEMLGETVLSAEKQKRFPYIITPEVRVPLVNLRWFDLSVDEAGDYINPKDAAEYRFFELQDFVAKSKESVIPGTHYFYVENIEKEAEERVSTRQMRYKAQKLVIENTNINRYKEIALLLNYRVDKISILVDNLSDVVIQDKILEACETHPYEVIRCFEKGAAEDIFILKAASYQIIQMKGKSFFDGQEYLGDTLEAVKKFMHTENGKKYMLRWSRHISEREDSVDEFSDTEAKRMENVLSQLSMAIIDEDWSKAKSLVEQGELIDFKNADLIKLAAKIPGVTMEDPEVKKRIRQLKMQAGKLKIPRDIYENVQDEQEMQKIINDAKGIE